MPATLRLADQMAGGTTTVEGLAGATGCDADALGRVMDHLVTAGLLTRVEGGYGLTGLGAAAARGRPGRGAGVDRPGRGRWGTPICAWSNTVRTGEAAYPRRYGRPYWDDLAADPRRAATFDTLMGGRLGADAPVIPTAYHWGALGHLADVGGGDGT